MGESDRTTWKADWQATTTQAPKPMTSIEGVLFCWDSARSFVHFVRIFHACLSDELFPFLERKQTAKADPNPEPVSAACSGGRRRRQLCFMQLPNTALASNSPLSPHRAPSYSNESLVLEVRWVLRVKVQISLNTAGGTTFWLSAAVRAVGRCTTAKPQRKERSS